MTQTEYARAANLSKARVSQLVKAGMPLSSPEDADRWRGMSAQKRAALPTASKSTPAQIEDQGPLRPPEAGGKVNPSLVSADTPHGAYERQRQIERAAYDLATRALLAKQHDAGRLVGIHARAARNLTAARQEVLDLSARERTLVSGEWVRKVMTDHDGAVATLIKAMPKSLAARIAPHDPEHAERELTRWVEETALATLSKTNPWK